MSFAWGDAAGAAQAGVRQRQQDAASLESELADREYKRQLILAQQQQQEIQRQRMGMDQQEFTAKQQDAQQHQAAIEAAAAGAPTPYIGTLVKAGLLNGSALLPADQKQAEPFTLGPGQMRFGPDGKVIAQSAAANGAASGFTLSPGQARYGPDGQVIAQSAQKPAASSELNELRADQLRQTMADAQGKKDAASRGASQTTQDTIDVIKQLADVDPKTGQLRLKSATQNLYGMRNPLAPYFPGSDTATASGALERLKGRVIVDLMNEMKQQSRTGATGFGALSEKELSVLENAATQLSSANISDVAAQRELQRLYDTAVRLHNAAGGNGGGGGGRVYYDANGRPVSR
jgi:hypothetical protein